MDVPQHLRDVPTTQLTRDEILEILEANGDAGANLTFSGKTNARRLRRKVRPRVSRELRQLGIGDAETRSDNLVIEGDNLQAMVTLYKERGRVDLILTDPPYNTGRDFRYSDRWEDDPNSNEIGEFVPEDDPSRHTKWMRFMWPRLQMMKSMLKPSGVLAICIDHRELFRLGQMLDELFGERNRLGVINWQKSYAPRNDNQHLSTATEYVLVYAKDEGRAVTGLLDRTEAMDRKYSNPDADPEGDWRPDNATAPSADTHQGMVYAIQSPFTGKLQWPPEGRCWGAERRRMKAWLEAWGSNYEDRELDDGCALALVLKEASIESPPGPGEGPYPTPDDPVVKKASKKAFAIHKKGPWPALFFGMDGLGRANTKRYMKYVKKGSVPMTYWADEDYEDPLVLEATSWDHEESGHSQAGVRELDAVVGKKHGFQTVKPLRLFSKIIQIWCPPEGLVLDPFGGSGTTGHCVLKMNHDIGTSRRFILIEQGSPEKGDSYARTLTSPRLQRVVTGDWMGGASTPTGGGFSFRTLGKTVDAEALLQMERDEMVDTLIASHFDSARRRGDQLTRLEREGDPYRYLVGRNADHEGFFLVWDGNGKTDFTEEVYEECAVEAEAASLKPSPYHVYARLYRYQTEGVRFYQIPDRILADFGLDLSSEPFASDDEVDG